MDKPGIDQLSWTNVVRLSSLTWNLSCLLPRQEPEYHDTMRQLKGQSAYFLEIQTNLRLSISEIHGQFLNTRKEEEVVETKKRLNSLLAICHQFLASSREVPSNAGKSSPAGSSLLDCTNLSVAIVCCENIVSSSFQILDKRPRKWESGVSCSLLAR